MTVSSSAPRTERDRQLTARLDAAEDAEQVVGRPQVAVARLHEEVALLDAGGRRRAVVDDTAHEQPVALVEPDRLAQPSGDVRRRQRDTEADPLERPAGGHRLHRLAQRGIDGAGEVEPVLEAVRVDRDDTPGAIQHGRP